MGSEGHRIQALLQNAKSQVWHSLAATLGRLRKKESRSIENVDARRHKNPGGREAECAEVIPVVHRLAIIYLMLPVVIWLVGWFEWWFGVPAAVLMALGLWQALRPARTSLKWSALRSALRPTTVILLLIALAWVMTTAAGGVFDAHNWDWNKHRSILLDLGRGDWPTEPTANLRAYLGEPFLLRYYLGYYMAPGSIGRWLGPAALNWAVPLWTWCGAALAMFMFTRGHRGWRMFAAAAILVFFGGMDIVRTLLLDGWGWIEFNIDFQGWPRLELGSYHIEWAGNKWGIVIQYPSHTAGLLWAPTHFIAGALFTLLLYQLRRHPRFLAVCGIVLAAAPFWSAFVAIGLLPFTIALLIHNGIRPFLRWQNLLLALPLAVLLIVYLSSGTGDIERSWIWEIQENGWQAAIQVLLVAYLFDFLLLAGLLFVLRPKIRRDPFFAACLATLLLLPWYSYGINNDLVMRGVVPALCLLSYFCAGAVADYSHERLRSKNYGYLASFGLLIAALAVGAFTPLFDLTRANNDHDFGVIRHEKLGPEYSIMRSLEVAHPKQHVTVELPDWYLRLLRIDAIDETAASANLVAQSVYNVYLDDRTLIYTKKSCLEDEEGSRFFLHVVPLDLASLPEGRLHDNLDFYFTRKYAFQIGQTCFAVRELSDSYEIGHLVTGKLNKEHTGHSWIAHYFGDAYRSRLLAEAGEPIIRSKYTVYLHREMKAAGTSKPERRRLLYHMARCLQEDTDARFYLHVVPANSNDLPEGREEAGYVALDFDFDEFGGRQGGDCFVERALPEYEILEIRTGQSLAGRERLWEGRFTFGD